MYFFVDVSFLIKLGSSRINIKKVDNSKTVLFINKIVLTE